MHTTSISTQLLKWLLERDSNLILITHKGLYQPVPLQFTNRNQGKRAADDFEGQQNPTKIHSSAGQINLWTSYRGTWYERILRGHAPYIRGYLFYDNLYMQTLLLTKEALVRGVDDVWDTRNDIMLYNKHVRCQSFYQISSISPQSPTKLLSHQIMANHCGAAIFVSDKMCFNSNPQKDRFDSV